MRSYSVSKQSGLFVFTATPELAKAMPKIFRQGATYTVQRADTVIEAVRPNAGTKKVASTTSVKKTTKKVGKPGKSQASKVVKSTAPKLAKAGKGGRGKKAASPEVVVQFVRDNDGCNMTQIEAATKMAQPDIRKALNDAREAGLIRTEGQRRGLRYFAIAAAASAPSDKPVAAGSTDTPW